MNDVRRYDRPAALITTMVNNMARGSKKMKEFMPYGQEEKEATFEDIIKVFGGVNGKFR